jgi:hypothetical protein
MQTTISRLTKTGFVVLLSILICCAGIAISGRFESAWRTEHPLPVPVHILALLCITIRRIPLPVYPDCARWTKQLKSEGIGIFLIRHDLYDVFDLSDRVSVIKNGRLIGNRRTKDEVLGMIIMGKLPKAG